MVAGVLGDLGEVLGVQECGEVAREVEQRPGAAPALLLAASCAVLGEWGALVHRAMEEGEGEEVWRVRAALVNKCPHLAPPLDSTPPEGVAWLAAGLVRRGDGAAAPWLGRLVEQVGEGREGAVEGVGRLLGACWWRHAVTGVLYKQRAWSYLLPALTAPEGGPGRLAALVMLLPHLPRPLLVPRLPALLPLVVRALSDPTTALHALNCLGDFVKVEVSSWSDLCRIT